MGFIRKLCGIEKEGGIEKKGVIGEYRSSQSSGMDRGIQSEAFYQATPNRTRELEPTQRELLARHYRETFAADLPPGMNDAEVTRQYQQIMSARARTSQVEAMPALSNLPRDRHDVSTGSHVNNATQASYNSYHSSSNARSQIKKPSQTSSRSPTSSRANTDPSQSIPPVPNSTPATVISAPSQEPPQGNIQPPPISRRASTQTDDDNSIWTGYDTQNFVDALGSSAYRGSTQTRTDTRSLPTSDFTFRAPESNHRMSTNTASSMALPSRSNAKSDEQPPVRSRAQSSSTFNPPPPEPLRYTRSIGSTAGSHVEFRANVGASRIEQTISEPQTPGRHTANGRMPGAYYSTAASDSVPRNYAPAEPRDEYHVLIDHAVRRAREVGSAFSGVKSVNGQSKSPFVSSSYIKDLDGMMKGALGEAYVFELFSSLNIPNFSRDTFVADNWNSSVRRYLQDYDAYENLDLFYCRKDPKYKFKYTDKEGTLTRFIMKNCVGGFPAIPTTANGGSNTILPIEYWFEVKSTPADRWAPFSFKDDEFQCLQGNPTAIGYASDPMAQQGRRLYVLLKVYDLGPKIAMDIYVEPKRLAKRGGCLEEFRAFNVSKGVRNMGSRAVRGTH